MNKLLDFFGFGQPGEGGSTGPNKRNIWLAGLAVIGVLLLVFSTVDRTKPDQQQTTNVDTSGKQIQEQVQSGMSKEEEALSKRLCEMLKKIEGAGEVEVSVRLSNTTQSEYAVNTTTSKKTTQERDQSGGTRVTNEDSNSNQIVVNRNGQEEEPVIEREVAPHVAGILVVAEGAGNVKVKAMLFQATKVATGIEPQKILVLPRERSK